MHKRYRFTSNDEVFKREIHNAVQEGRSQWSVVRKLRELGITSVNGGKVHQAHISQYSIQEKLDWPLYKPGHRKVRR